MDNKEGNKIDDLEISFPLIDGKNELLRHLSPSELLSLGMSVVAYVRPAIEDEEEVYQIYAADGTILATLEDYHLAVSTISFNDLHEVALH